MMSSNYIQAKVVGEPADKPLTKGPVEQKSYFPMEFKAEELLKTRTTVLEGTDPEAKRAEIRAYFHKTFTLYEKLFDVLVDDSVYYRQPEPLRHPLVFYFGHTAVFFVNKLRVSRVISDRVDNVIESTCAIGVDEMSWDDLNSKHYDWPTIDRLREYRNEVRAVVDRVIQTAKIELPITWSSPLWIVMMGIEHERIHLETSSVLFRQLPIECIKPISLFQVCPYRRTGRVTATRSKTTGTAPIGSGVCDVVSVSSAVLPSDYDAASLKAGSVAVKPAAAAAPVPRNGLVDVPGGHVSLAKRFSHPLYGWDNEYGRHEMSVSNFSASRYLVSNGEFLRFVLDGGYQNAKWWTDEGWGFVTYKRTEHPTFWVPVRDAAGEVTDYKYRTMCEEIDMPWDWPVDVNNLEAKAFCTWLNHKVNGSHGSGAAAASSSSSSSSSSSPEGAAAPATAGDSDPAAGIELSGSGQIRLPTEEEWFRLREYATLLKNGPQGRNSADDAAAAITVHSEDQPYWTDAPGNINLEYWSSSCPVDVFGFNVNTSKAGLKTQSDAASDNVYDLIGNVWQHTETPMAPFEGFKVHPAYDDFTVPTFDNMHNMIKGGSWIATGNEATTHARYAFRRHFYQHAGFRYVRSNVTLKYSNQLRESVEDDPNVANAIYDHYVHGSHLHAPAGKRAGRGVDAFPNYSVALAAKVVDVVRSVQSQDRAGAGAAGAAEAVPGLRTERVLELGCSVGRGTFELAKTFGTAIGLDFSTRFIRIGMSLRAVGRVGYAIPDIGSLTRYGKVDLLETDSGSVLCSRDELAEAAKSGADPAAAAPAETAPDAAAALASVVSTDALNEANESVVRQVQGRVDFIQGDACNMDRKKLNDFDVVVVASGLTNLYSPDRLLTDLHTRVRLGGLLILSSTYEWNEARTPKPAWLGGYKDERTGEIVSAIDAVAAKLDQHFERVAVPAAAAASAAAAAAASVGSGSDQAENEWDLVSVRRKNSRSSEVRTNNVTAWRKVRN